MECKFAKWVLLSVYLNDKVLSFFESHELPMLPILTDRGPEYYGRVDQHDYQLYLATNDIDHTKSKAMSPPNERHLRTLPKTILNEFYKVAFHKKLYSSLEKIQKDLDGWVDYYNNERTHQGKMCCDRTPLETLIDGKAIWAEKNLAQITYRHLLKTGNCQIKSELLHLTPCSPGNRERS